NGDVAQYLDITFLARYTGGTPHVADDENLDVAWFALDALPENLTATSRLRIEKAIAGEPSAWFRR
ncbi:MAG: NUDIX hydrolase, partial [Rhodococcus sp. (in: high G+C Gram-positive bacteria)]